MSEIYDAVAEAILDYTDVLMRKKSLSLEQREEVYRTMLDELTRHRTTYNVPQSMTAEDWDFSSDNTIPIERIFPESGSA